MSAPAPATATAPAGGANRQAALAAAMKVQAEEKLRVGCYETPYSFLGALGYTIFIWMFTSPFWLVGVYLYSEPKTDYEEDLGLGLLIVGFLFAGPLWLIFMFLWLKKRLAGPPAVRCICPPLVLLEAASTLVS
ncbi:uncharacterized protein MONBRDRAFT_26562 [Monosiga brevicollis MX1]|uniref:Uncharacterized protein n=1 Tax=Monosiga brevicollis TaxID=81824 RepID=A9V2Q8_MONBE|nr:uncharacterized protein MONBRDRAFT_26562 [Monosiga brevicollis MX1]EDQ88414.1 predicted protein [Monosiga brevicollis MX1]|eukprot:XP_001747007.1 hypothetical protein [Monosiga brevicollis MX1]